MRLTEDSPLVQAIAAALNRPPALFEQIVILVQLPEGVAALHTMCCHRHMTEGLAEMVKITPTPYEDGPN